MTEDDRELLAFEEAHPRNDRRKEALITSRFGFSWVRYHQRLLTLSRDADAVAAFPDVIRRALAPAPGLRRPAAASGSRASARASLARGL
jgi:hypothetical protein